MKDSIWRRFVALEKDMALLLCANITCLRPGGNVPTLLSQKIRAISFFQRFILFVFMCVSLCVKAGALGRQKRM